MDKICVSVVNVKADISISVGDNITLIRDLENQYDAYAVKCFKQGSFAGYVSASNYTTLDGCKKNRDIVKYLEDGVIKGKVIGAETRRFKNGADGIIYRVELDI